MITAIAIFFDKLNSSKVVDDSDGHMYMVNVRNSFGGSYSLTPLQNGKQAMIDKNWQKLYKDND